MGNLILMGMVIATCITHCILGMKIRRKKKSLSYLGGSGGHQQPKVFALSHPDVSNNPTTSYIFGHLSSVLLITSLILFVPLIHILLFLFGGLPLFLVVRVATLSALLVVTSLSVYIRKPHVRTTLARELKELLRRQ